MIWNLASTATPNRLKGHKGSITNVAWSVDTPRLASTSRDGNVRIWDTTNAESIIHSSHKDAVTSLAWSPDGTNLATVSYDTVRVWDFENEIEVCCLQRHTHTNNWFPQLAWSPDGRHLICGVHDIHTMIHQDSGSPIVGASFAHLVGIWDGQKGTELVCLGEHGREDPGLAWSPDGRRIASDEGRTVRVWDSQTGVESVRFSGGDTPIPVVVWAPASCRIARGTRAGTVEIWDVESALKLLDCRGHEGAVECLSWSMLGDQVASGATDKTVRVWNTDSGDERHCLRGHEGTVKRVVFSRDGQWIVSESADVRVWDAKTGECMKVIAGTGDVAAIAAPRRFPWRALQRGLETVVEESATGKPIAWFPIPLNCIVTHPSGRVWAGASYNHVYILQLESGGSG